MRSRRVRTPSPANDVGRGSHARRANSPRYAPAMRASVLLDDSDQLAIADVEHDEPIGREILDEVGRGRVVPQRLPLSRRHPQSPAARDPRPRRCRGGRGGRTRCARHPGGRSRGDVLGDGVRRMRPLPGRRANGLPEPGRDEATEGSPATADPRWGQRRPDGQRRFVGRLRPARRARCHGDQQRHSAGAGLHPGVRRRHRSRGSAQHRRRPSGRIGRCHRVRRCRPQRDSGRTPRRRRSDHRHRRQRRQARTGPPTRRHRHDRCIRRRRDRRRARDHRTGR